MSIASPYDGLLPARTTLGLLDLIAVSDGRGHPDQLIADFSKAHSVSRSRTANTLGMLAILMLLEITEGTVSLRHTTQNDARPWQVKVQTALAVELSTRLDRLNIGSAIQYRSSDGAVWLDSLQLPGAELGLLMWVVDFQVAYRDSVHDRFWRLNSDFAARYLQLARSANQRRLPATGLTLVELLEIQRSQLEAGRAAERWVLAHERLRLADHPMIDQIRIVSEADVTLGYDILSFSGSGALVHDLFIEVKSVGHDLEFFWSKNEVDTAERLGLNYSLYLVDRTRMDDAQYAPSVISNPFVDIISSEMNIWNASPESFRVRRLANG